MASDVDSSVDSNVDSEGKGALGGTSFRASPQPPLPAHVPEQPRRYRLYPSAPLHEGRIELGAEAIAARLALVLERGGTVRLDGTVGVLWERLRQDVARALAARELRPDWHDVQDATLDEARLDALVQPFLTDDPLFGHRFEGELRDLFDDDALVRLAEVAGGSGPRIVFGPGAALVGHDDDFLAYVTVPRAEAQYRARAGAVTNLGEAAAGDAKAMYKRFYFVDWVVGARHAERLLPRLDLVIDAQRPDEPACATGDAVRAGLAVLGRSPFRTRPWFAPGPWGGQWIKAAVPELPQEVPNYAWSFELIAPENGLVFEDGGRLLEVPFEWLMFQERERMLGTHVRRFGNAFPIRFDFLDTVNGGPLSLQVHPAPDFARERFGEPFTQDETYYLLHAEPDAEVFLGFQEDIDADAFRAELERSARDGTPVEVRRHVQSHPARRHDLFLIPHGTVHCSGAGALVLEISATPYIFTFKLYDWLRLDLDGAPRPLNLERAFANLNFERRGEVVPRTLIARPVELETGELEAGEYGRVVHLPTHEDHFYDVHRMEFRNEIEVRSDGSVHVLSLVEGDAVEIETDDGRRVTYYFAETFAVPAAVGRYRLRSPDGAPLKVVKAFLK